MARTSLTTLVKSAARRAGVDVSRYNARSNDKLRLSHFLKLHNIRHVLDVGANYGQFAEGLFAGGYGGSITSFEALPNAHAVITRKAAAFGERWKIAPQAAISNEDGTAVFNVAEGDYASSLLEVTADVAKAAPAIGIAQKITVKTRKLDGLVAELGIDAKNCLVKLDVQGAELMVLEGASNTLEKARGVVSEVSFSVLYESQTLANTLSAEIEKFGFEIWDIWPGYRPAETLRLLQADFVWFKTQS